MYGGDLGGAGGGGGGGGGAQPFTLAVRSLISQAASRSTSLTLDSQGLTSRRVRASEGAIVRNVSTGIRALAGAKPGWCPGGTLHNRPGAVHLPAPQRPAGDGARPSSGDDEEEPATAAAEAGSGGGAISSVALAIESPRPAPPAAALRAESRKRRERVCEKIGSYHQREGAAARRQAARIPLLQRLAPGAAAAAAAVAPAPAEAAAASSSSCAGEPRPAAPLALRPPLPPAAEAGGLAVLGAPAAAERAPVAAAPRAVGEAAAKCGPAAAGVRAAAPPARRRQPLAASSILPTVDAQMAGRSEDLTTTGPLQIAIINADGELELQALTSEDLKRSAKHQAAKKEAIREELRKKIEVQQQVRLVKPANYKKKSKAGAGVLSKLMQIHARSGSLAHDPPREAFFQAW